MPHLSVVAILLQIQCAQQPLESSQLLRYGQVAYRIETGARRGEVALARFEAIERIGDSHGVKALCAEGARSHREASPVTLELEAPSGLSSRLVAMGIQTRGARILIRVPRFPSDS